MYQSIFYLTLPLYAVTLILLVKIREIDGAGNGNQQGQTAQGQKQKSHNIKNCDGDDDCNEILSHVDADAGDIFKICYRENDEDPHVCGIAYLKGEEIGGNQVARIPNQEICVKMDTNQKTRKSPCGQFLAFAKSSFPSHEFTAYDIPTFLCTPKGSNQGYIACPIQVKDGKPHRHLPVPSEDSNRKKLPPPYCKNDADCESFMSEEDRMSSDIARTCFLSDPSNECTPSDPNCEHICGFSYVKSECHMMAKQEARNPNKSKCRELSGQKLKEAMAVCDIYREYQENTFPHFKFTAAAPPAYSCEGSQGVSYVSCVLQAEDDK